MADERIQRRLERVRAGLPADYAELGDAGWLAELGPRWAGAEASAGRGSADSLVGRAGPRSRALALLRRDDAGEGPEPCAGRRIVTLHGPRGAGTSALAREVARTLLDRYPGGVWLLDAGAATAATAPPELLRVARGRGLSGVGRPASPCCRAHLALRALAERPSLLVFDGAPDWTAVREWLPPVEGDCDVLVASSGQGWPAAWHPIEVPPLAADASAALVRAARGVRGWEGRDADGGAERVVHASAAGCTTVLVALARAGGRGDHRSGVFRSLVGGVAGRRRPHPASPAAAAPFAALGAGTDGADARLVLRALSVAADRAVPLDELRAWLGPLGWHAARLERALGKCLRAGLLDADVGLRFSGILGAALAAVPTARSERAPLRRIRTRQRELLLEDARALAESAVAAETDDERRGRFVRLAGRSSTWMDAAPARATSGLGPPSPAEARDLALALHRCGLDAEARHWVDQGLAGPLQGADVDPALPAELHALGGRLLGRAGAQQAAGEAFRAAAAAATTPFARAESLRRAASAWASGGDPDAACGLAEEALRIHARLTAGGTVRTDAALVEEAEAHFARGSCLERADRREPARRAYERALALFRGPLGRLPHPHPPGAPPRVAAPVRAGVTAFRLGTLLTRAGRTRDGATFFADAAAFEALGNRHGIVNHLDVGRSLYEQASVLESTGRLDEAVPVYERAAEVEARGDWHGRQDPESLGSTLHALARTKAKLEAIDAAVETFLRAAALRRRGDVHGVVDHGSAGASLHMAGLTLSRNGRNAEARGHFEAALEATRRGDGSGGVDHESIGRSLHEIGHCLYGVGRSAEALHWYERAIEAKQRGDAHGRVDHESLGLAHEMRAACLYSEGDLGGARQGFVAAITAAERGDADGVVNPESVRNHHHRLGVTCMRLDDHAAARVAFRVAIDRGERLLANAHDFDRRDLAGSWIDLGTSYLGTDETVRADDAFERAVGVCGGARADGQDDGGAWWALHGVGLALIRAGRLDRALTWFERAGKEAEQGDADGVVDHERVSKSLHEGGWCLADEGRTSEALAWFARALTASRSGDRAGRVDRASVGTTLHEIGWCLTEEGREEEALARFEEAVREKEHGAPDGRLDHDSIGRTLNELGWCHLEREDYDAARAAYLRALQCFERASETGPVEPDGEATALRAIGRCTLLLGDAKGARPWFERAVAKYSFGDARGVVDHARLGLCQRRIGDCYDEVERFARARTWYERAAAAYERARPDAEGHTRVLASVRRKVAHCLEREGRFDEAREWHERAESWRDDEEED